jgi:hypothetical protein
MFLAAAGLTAALAAAAPAKADWDDGYYHRWHHHHWHDWDRWRRHEAWRRWHYWHEYNRGYVYNAPAYPYYGY